MSTPLHRAVQIHKAIAHPVRLRILSMLNDGPLCGCQISAIVKLAASTVSEHLSELRRAGLVAEKKEGRWVEYRLANVDEPLATALRGIAGDPAVRADAILAKALRRVPLEELCSVGLDLGRLGRPLVDTAVERSERVRLAGETK